MGAQALLQPWQFAEGKCFNALWDTVYKARVHVLRVVEPGNRAQEREGRLSSPPRRWLCAPRWLTQGPREREAEPRGPAELIGRETPGRI